MVKFCAVYDCSNRSDREKTKSYYRIPQVVTKQGKEALKLSTERRGKWINAINRKDLDEKSCEPHHRVCSDHFHTGKFFG